MSQLRPPPHSPQVTVSFPEDHVLLITLDRPNSLNAMTPLMSRDLHNILAWFDDQPQLWVVVLTGNGRIFCAGADLKEWSNFKEQGDSSEQETSLQNIHGFASLSRRDVSNKPIIAAVNGGAFGGGVELILNCDLVVAGEDAKFALPEVKRGVVAVQGGIPRLARIAGHQLASELLLTGKTISAREACDRFRFVNHVVAPDQVLAASLSLAREIVSNSPDAVQSTKRALLLSQRHNVPETFQVHVWAPESRRVYEGDNIKEGLQAFAQRRKPAWKSPTKL